MRMSQQLSGALDLAVATLPTSLVERQGKVLRIYFRADAAFAMPGVPSLIVPPYCKLLKSG